MTLLKFRPTPHTVRPFDDLMHEFFNGNIGRVHGSDDVKHSTPRANIVENEKDLRVQLLVPGFDKADLKVNVENDVLTISAEKESSTLNENERYTRREFSHSTFSRSFRLPEGVNDDTIAAEYVNGVLTLTIPKAEIPKPKAREISVG